MSDDKTVTVTISAKALDDAHALLKLAGYENATDRMALESAISAHVQDFREMVDRAMAKQGGPKH